MDGWVLVLLCLYQLLCYHDGSSEAEMRKNFRGFTLIEILVVVAIIIILAAILLPSIFRAKDSVIQTKCASNLRQIGLAFSMYTQDNDDTLPMGAYMTNTLTPPVVVVPTPLQGQPYRITWRDILTNCQYIKTYEIYVCPAAPNHDYQYSYGVNRWIVPWCDPDHQTVVKIDSIPYPTNTALVSEKKGYDWPIFLPLQEEAINPFYRPMDPRHANRLNLLFLDGHVKSVGVGDLISSSTILWDAVPH